MTFTKKIGWTPPLKVVHFNIRGIEKNFDNLILYLNSLNHSFDVICLSEIHITNVNHVKNRFTMEGYTVEHETVATGKAANFWPTATNSWFLKTCSDNFMVGD